MNSLLKRRKRFLLLQIRVTQLVETSNLYFLKTLQNEFIIDVLCFFPRYKFEVVPLTMKLNIGQNYEMKNIRITHVTYGRPSDKRDEQF